MLIIISLGLFTKVYQNLTSSDANWCKIKHKLKFAHLLNRFTYLFIYLSFAFHNLDKFIYFILPGTKEFYKRHVTCNVACLFLVIFSLLLVAVVVYHHLTEPVRLKVWLSVFLTLAALYRPDTATNASLLNPRFSFNSIACLILNISEKYKINQQKTRRWFYLRAQCMDLFVCLFFLQCKATQEAVVSAPRAILYE